jgi:hypothetical protein
MPHMATEIMRVNWLAHMATTRPRPEDRMCRAAVCAGQAGRTATQIVSCPRRKRTKTDRLHRQDPLDMPLLPQLTLFHYAKKTLSRGITTEL